MMADTSHSPLAMFRGYPSRQLAHLADKHLQNDLSAADRVKLKSAAARVSTHAAVGSLLGLAVGVALARRIRLNRIAMFKALRAMEKPTAVIFSNGRREAVPDLAPLLRPTAWGDAATFSFFGLAGLFVGGETGFLTGTASARRSIREDPAFQKRIEEAFRKFRIDVLKEEIKQLEGASASSGSATGGNGGSHGGAGSTFGWDTLETSGWQSGL